MAQTLEKLFLTKVEAMSKEELELEIQTAKGGKKKPRPPGMPGTPGVIGTKYSPNRNNCPANCS